MHRVKRLSAMKVCMQRVDASKRRHDVCHICDFKCGTELQKQPHMQKVPMADAGSTQRLLAVAALKAAWNCIQICRQQFPATVACKGFARNSWMQMLHVTKWLSTADEAQSTSCTQLFSIAAPSQAEAAHSVLFACNCTCWMQSMPSHR